MEEGMYGLASTAEYSDKAPMTPENLIFPAEYQSYLMSGGGRIPMFGSEELLSGATEAEPSSNNLMSSSVPQIQRHSSCDAASSLIKAKIASHPHYPRLLQAYIDCQKVGAPAEIASLLDEIQRENDFCKSREVVGSTCIGADPELDEFMETYCEMLVKYKCDLTRPFDEATSFLNKIETQLSNLCCTTTAAAAAASAHPLSDDGGVSSEEELSGGDGDGQLRDEDRDLKDKLLRKFGSHIGTLKLEFSKKKKRGKLPKDARQTLLQWWNTHYKWPYPTEADKIALAKSTGLDQKQINNWFINQRKRHWKPSENMQFNFCDGQII